MSEILHQNLKNKMNVDDLLYAFSYNKTIEIINKRDGESYLWRNNDDIQLTKVEKTCFIKGACLGVHMFSYIIYITFRYDIFEDLTFYRMIRNFQNHSMYISFPHVLQSQVIDAMAEMDTHLLEFRAIQ